MRDAATNRMFIKRKGPALHEVEPWDVLVHDLADDAALKTTPHMHFEAVLHTEVYKRRSDVHSVIHSHPPYATAFGATDAEFEILSHDGVLFADGVARFDSYELITEPAQGRQVAEALGQRRGLLLKNHGVLVVGSNVKWAVLAAVTLERSVKIQTIAGALGKLSPIPVDAARQFMKRKYADRYMDEYWASWKRTVRGPGASAPRQAG